jgi:predicted small secreted protein
MALTPESDTMYRLIALLLIAFAVAGCNTVEGMGKDISKGGDAVQDAAQSVKKKM